MDLIRRRRWNVAAAIAATISAVMAILYIVLIRQQDDTPVAWFLGGLALAVMLCGYGVVQAGPRGVAALGAAGVVLVALGMLSILSIGFPVLAAGVLAFIAAVRARPANA